MKSIKNHIIFITYEDRIDERHNTLLIQDILQLKDHITSKKFKGIFISLEHIPYDTKSLMSLIQTLDKISKTLHIKIGFGNYENNLYKILIAQTKTTNIKLYKNANIAQLFLDPQFFSKKLKVLIYDDGNEENIDKLSSILTQYDHIVFYASNITDFQHKLLNDEFDFAISQTIINGDEKITTETKAKFLLSKNLISHLPLFVDTAVESLVTITNLEAKKIAHGIKTFNVDVQENSISSIMQFKGDVDGNFILIFPKKLAIKAIEAMVGESIDANHMDEITDGIGEFCNIITGSIKTMLSKNDIKVLFELPKTYVSLSTIRNILNDNNGIWIDMQLANQPFYIFIVK